MSAEHGIIRAIDKLAFNGQPPTRDEDFELDGDEDSGDEAAPQGGSTNTSSKKKKKKKPKKKKAATNPLLGSIPPEIPAPAPESDEDRLGWEALLGPDSPLHEPPVVGLVEERVTQSQEDRRNHD